MRSSRFARISTAALVLLLVVGFSFSTSAGERLLQRQRPLSLRWGEVNVSETELVKITKEGTETTYPNAVALVFRTRLREEEIAGLLDGTLKARSQSATVGTLYVAGRMAEGRAAWDRFVVRLQEAAGRLTPAAYDEFLVNSSAVGNAAHPEPGEYALAVCVLRPGASDRQFDITQTITKSDRGSEATEGTSVYPTGGRFCGPLREAFQGRAASDILTTGFAVDDSLEETLELVVSEHAQQPPAALPQGVSLSRKDVPEGVNAFRSTSRDGKVHAETLRHDGEGGSGPGRGKDYLVVVDLQDATLARDLPSSTSVLARGAVWR